MQESSSSDLADSLSPAGPCSSEPPTLPPRARGASARSGASASASPTRILSPPAILYNASRVSALTGELARSVSTETMGEIQSALDEIQSRCDDIRRQLGQTEIVGFVGLIRDACTEVEGLIERIYLIAHPENSALAESLKNELNDVLTPAKRYTDQLIFIDETTLDKNPFKTRRLFAEQALMLRDAKYNRPLESLLAEIKAQFVTEEQPLESCFISYAWPTGSHPVEKTLQVFLKGLRTHLRAAGIMAVLDIEDNTPDASFHQFMTQAETSSKVLLICTESLKAKYLSDRTQANESELSYIRRKHDRDKAIHGVSGVYPALISGEMGWANLPEHEMYATVKDWREKSYVNQLADFIEWVYLGMHTSSDSPDIKRQRAAYRGLWDTYTDAHPKPTLNEHEVDTALSSYYKTTFEALQKTPAYQAVQAEQTDEAMLAERVSGLSSLAIPQKLLSTETGLVFQRPADNKDFFVERGRYCGYIRERFKEAHNTHLALTTYDLGGVGKTQLALDYFLRPDHPYELRAWFHAKSELDLQLQYVGLGVELEKEHQLSLHAGQSIEEQANQVKAWLSRQSDFLLVYDDAPDRDTLTPWIPEGGNHHVLVASRNGKDDWFGPSNKLDVTAMTLEEGIDLVKKITGSTESDEALKVLVEDTLKSLPVAIGQAASYMATNSMDAKAYLALYAERQEALSKETEMPEGIEHEAVWVTFDLNYEAVEKICPEGMGVLNHVAWLGAQAIPEKLLIASIEGTEDTILAWQKVKQTLKQYSLLRIGEDSEIHMHARLQDMVRNKQGREQKRVLEKTCGLLNALCYHYEDSGSKDYRGLLPHAVRLHEHASDLRDQITPRAGAGGPRDNLPLLAASTGSLGHILYELGLYRQAHTFWKDNLEILKHHYGEDHVEVAITLENLANAEGDLGNAAQEKALLLQALEIKKRYYGNDHVNVAGTLGNLANAEGALGDATRQKALLLQALETLKRHYGNDHVEVARTLGNLANAEESLGNAAEGKALSLQALEIQKRHYGSDHPEVARTLGNLAISEYVLGKTAEAKTLWLQALKIQKHHYGKNHVIVAQTLGNLANAEGDLGNVALKKALLLQALKIEKRHYGENHVEIAITLGNLANAEGDLGDAAQEKALLLQALEIQKRHYGEDHIHVATTLDNLANAEGALGDTAWQKALLLRALEIKKRHYASDHPEVARTLGNLGGSEYILGHAAEAKALLLQAIEIEKRHYGEDHVVVAQALNNLASVEAALGNEAMEKHLSLQALEILKRHFGEDHIEVAHALGNIASAEYALGQAAEAKMLWLQALEIKKRHYGEDHVEVAKTLGNLANVEGDLGDVAQQKALLLQALEVLKRHYGSDHIEVAIALGNLASAEGALGDAAQQKALLLQALEIKKHYYGEDHVSVALTLGNLANAEGALGDTAQEKVLLRQALEIEKRHYGSDHIEVARTMGSLARAELALGQVAEAKALWLQTLEIEKRYYGENHREVAKTVYNFANAQAMMGDISEAIESLRRADRIYATIMPLHPIRLRIDGMIRWGEVQLTRPSSLESESRPASGAGVGAGHHSIPTPIPACDLRQFNAQDLIALASPEPNTCFLSSQAASSALAGPFPTPSPHRGPVDHVAPETPEACPIL